MTSAVQSLWLIPVLPLLAAGLLAFAKQRHRVFAGTLAIVALVASFIVACGAFAATLGAHGERAVFNFTWLQFGETPLRLGWVLDPLTAVMVVMVTLVGTLIFIFSVGYMAEDENFTRFFCFLSLFAAAMLGLVIANNLLLLFVCWELVGLASYLLIGFWYHKPSAAAAAKKAFIVTRIGDIGFFIGILWLYAETGTLLLYDNGNGCLEGSALAQLVARTTIGGMVVSTAIALLIFCGAMGKSGQVPLHVWLPDAMEGPTPVSALIHAATMVAAGVFLVARVYPLMDADPANVAGHSPALCVVTWIGAITAIFAALIAVAQNDIKRILAYSTVSQLGYMMLGLGTGGVAVGIFHLITHAFFKALLFLGAGSVIHGCHHEQDIRRMGGLRRFMPLTFATYAVGMMALAGFPLFFSGFWSKDEILHSAFAWAPSRWPFYLGAAGAVLTTFYMTRQMFYVFFGHNRADEPAGHVHVHESPAIMVVPLVILAAGAVLLSIVGTPAWPWFHAYLTGHAAAVQPVAVDVILIMLLSTALVALGLGLGWWLYGRRRIERADSPDPLEALQADTFTVLRQKFWIDEAYDKTVVRLNRALCRAADWLDVFVWGGLVALVSYLAVGIAWVNRLIDEYVVNLGFDKGCGSVRWTARLLSLWQNGQVQRYLRALGVALAIFVLIFIWGCRG
ncbi:MAG: NADH-quinone oxidoreductase subunit L [Verrucomicrobia subdivision 3 bacterium]|nr:NADH-quinone oxidoreductase subunit L [Limisphaerales bacterium]